MSVVCLSPSTIEARDRRDRSPDPTVANTMTTEDVSTWKRRLMCIKTCERCRMHKVQSVLALASPASCSVVLAGSGALVVDVCRKLKGWIFEAERNIVRECGVSRSLRTYRNSYGHPNGVSSALSKAFFARSEVVSREKDGKLADGVQSQDLDVKPYAA